MAINTAGAVESPAPTKKMTLRNTISYSSVAGLKTIKRQIHL